MISFLYYILLYHIAIISEHVFLYLPLLWGAYLAISLMKVPNLALESAVVMGAIGGAFVRVPFLSSNSFLSLVIGLIGALCCGAIVGIVTGLLHGYGKLSHLLSSIVMIGFVHGLSLLLLGGTHMTLSSSHIFLKSVPIFFLYPALAVLMIISGILSCCMVYFFRTNLGVICAIYGDNPAFLSNHKISSLYTVCMGLGIANGCAAISGYLIAQNNGFIDSGMGAGIPLLCITALMLGKIAYASEKPINGVQPLLGAFCYFIMQSILLSIGFDLRYFPLIQALVLASIFLIERESSRALAGV